MRRPSLQWYPADWRSNAKLRRCSWAARGAWVDIIGLLHDSDEYGVVRWTLTEIAHSIGCPLSLVRELAAKRVLKGCDEGESEAYSYTPRHAGKAGDPIELIASQQGPLWFSSRLVRDEFIRQHRGAATRFSDEPNPTPNRAPKATPKPPFGGAPKPTPTRRQGYGSTSSSSSSIFDKGFTTSTSVEIPTDDAEGQKPSGDKYPHNPENQKAENLPDLPPGWWHSDQGIDAAGRALGVRPIGTEDYQRYKDRLFAEIRRRRSDNVVPMKDAG